MRLQHLARPAQLELAGARPAGHSPMTSGRTAIAAASPTAQMLRRPRSSAP